MGALGHVAGRLISVLELTTGEQHTALVAPGEPRVPFLGLIYTELLCRDGMPREKAAKVMRILGDTGHVPVVIPSGLARERGFGDVRPNVLVAVLPQRVETFDLGKPGSLLP